MKGKIFCIPQTACHFPVFCQKYVGNFFPLFFCLHSLRCLTISLLGLWVRHLPSLEYWPRITATLQKIKTPNFTEVSGGNAFLGESRTWVAKMLGEVLDIFHPCLGTSKITYLHHGMRSYYSKYDLKLFFYSYKNWTSETRTEKASLTVWTESRRETQHWIPPGHGKGGKRHSQQCPDSTGTFPEGKAPLQLHNISLSACCGPQSHLLLFIKWIPYSWYPLTFREYSLYFVLVQEEHKYHMGGYPESRGLP